MHFTPITFWPILFNFFFRWPKEKKYTHEPLMNNGRYHRTQSECNAHRFKKLNKKKHFIWCQIMAYRFSTVFYLNYNKKKETIRSITVTRDKYAVNVLKANNNKKKLNTCATLQKKTVSLSLLTKIFNKHSIYHSYV